MPTQYKIQFMASHPLSMTFNPPTNASIMEAISAALEDNGLTPIASLSERIDDHDAFTEKEGKAWVHNAPDDLILAVAKMLDGFVAQMVDPESDVMAPDGGGPWDEPNAVWTANAFLEYRRQVAEDQS